MMKNALAKWEADAEMSLREAKEVELQFQIPPLDAMTMELAELVNCEKLSLSTNQIEKIFLPPSLQNLKVLSLSRNNIKTFVGLESLALTLEQLWISYNLIEKMKGIEIMKNLKVLYMEHNLVKDWNEFNRLDFLKENLKELAFNENPLVENMEEEAYRDEVAQRLPFIKMLDGDPLINFH